MCPTTAAAPVSAATPFPPVEAKAMPTAAAPLATSSTVTASARPIPVFRSTLAAPTLRLPTRRTSIPARRASRNAKGTDPAR